MVQSFELRLIRAISLFLSETLFIPVVLDQRLDLSIEGVVCTW